MTHVLLMSSLQLGSTAIGLKTKHGVVLVVEKRVTSPLLVILSTCFFFQADELARCIVTNCALGYSVENIAN
jgi:20S proteasome subunit alpha 5